MQQALQQTPPGRPAVASDDAAREQLTAARRAILKGLAIFAARRLAFGLAVLLAITYLSHFGMTAAQGVPVPEALQTGLVEAFDYLTRLAAGDLGQTIPGSAAFRPQPVGEVLADVLLRSFGLLAAAFLVAIVIGVPLGVWAAYRRRNREALLVLVASFIGMSVPSFFAALFLQIAAIEWTRTFGRAIVPVGGFGWDRHIVLPMLVLAARPIAQITRVTFVSLSEALEGDFVRTARGKGLRPDYTFFVHVIRNAAIPVLTTILVSLRFALGSLPVVEFYFGWNGLGQTLLRAMFNRDVNLVTALLLSLGFVFILVNLVLEVSYALIDPRLRERAERGQREAGGFLSGLASLAAEFRHFLRDNPFALWLRSRRDNGSVDPEPVERPSVEEDAVEQVSRWGAWRRGTLGNPPLLLGVAIVGALVVLVLFGPRLAPYSPNTTQIIAVKDGVISTPPFEPSVEHIWGTDPIGRDMFSLIVAGAQQTVTLAFAVVVARMFIGFALGVLAGWLHDGWLDRLIVGLTQALSVFPALILAALLIFALGIEKGMSTFIIALALVGWGEIVQFVRAEVIAVQPKPFIESARAVGQRPSRLLLIHVLPNLAPALISLAAIELGAVLLILGELGFIGIFLRGGAGTDFGLFSQVPEWGSLLSNIRNWVRSYPWTGFYPTAAFFIAVLGFNLLGEGLRRLIEEVGLVINRLLNRYTLGFAALAVAGLFWMRNNSGEIVFYRQQATAFEGDRAFSHVEQLTHPEMEGRALGTEGLASAAEYIAAQFEGLGLQPAGEDSTYFQATDRTYLGLDKVPELVVEDGEDPPEYLQDFSVFPAPTENQGQAHGPVRLLILGEEADVQGLDLTRDVVLLFDESGLQALGETRCQGVLVLAPDLSVLKRRHTLSPLPATPGCGRDTPVLWVAEKLANRLLKGTGEVVSGLAGRLDTLSASERLDLATGNVVSFSVQGSVRRIDPVLNVIGHLPGASASLDHELIVVAAQYDSPPLGLDGVYPGANDNASGVAAMLEVVRAMRESGYQPLRTFLFVAYSGEGLPGLEPAPAVETFLGARTGFATAFDLRAVIYVRGMGFGGEDTLAIWAEETTALTKVLESAVHLSGMQTERYEGPPSMNIFAPIQAVEREKVEYTRVGLGRQGWEHGARLSGDTPTFLSTELLEESGEALSLGLMLVGRD